MKDFGEKDYECLFKTDKGTRKSRDYLFKINLRGFFIDNAKPKHTNLLQLNNSICDRWKQTHSIKTKMSQTFFTARRVKGLAKWIAAYVDVQKQFSSLLHYCIMLSENCISLISQSEQRKLFRVYKSRQN